MSGSPIYDSGAYFMPFYTIFLKLTLHLLIDFAAIFAESDASENQEDEDPAHREEHSQRAYTWFFTLKFMAT